MKIMPKLQLSIKISVEEVREFANHKLLNRSVQTILNNHTDSNVKDIEAEIKKNISKEMYEMLEILYNDDENFTNGRESKTKQED